MKELERKGKTEGEWFISQMATAAGRGQAEARNEALPPGSHMDSGVLLAAISGQLQGAGSEVKP